MDVPRIPQRPQPPEELRQGEGVAAQHVHVRMDEGGKADDVFIAHIEALRRSRATAASM